jgi:cell division protein FtsQ
MSRTIKRGAPPRRPVVRKRKAARPPLGDRILAALPIDEAAVRRAATWAVVGVAGAGALAAAVLLGLPGAAGTALAEGAGRAGLRVEQIEITGLKRMDRMSVYAVALHQQSRAMPLVDLAGVRARLMEYGWVADAHVSRRLPDTLLVHIVEREPAAVFQDGGALTLIDAKGVPLEPVDPARMPDLPLVIGPGADRQEAAYQQLLAAAPALKPRVRAATWVGNRRWDLTFDSGERLMLPEEGAAQALVTFAAMDGAQKLLGRGWLQFDMRLGDRMLARAPGREHRLSIPDDGSRGGVGGGAGLAPARIVTAATAG